MLYFHQFAKIFTRESFRLYVILTQLYSERHWQQMVVVAVDEVERLSVVPAYDRRMMVALCLEYQHEMNEEGMQEKR